MENPDLIATWIPTDDMRRAENAFLLEHNATRYLPPEPIPAGPTISSRESTPAPPSETESQQNAYDEKVAVEDYTFTHRLQLTFGAKPNDPTRGFSFGTSKDCDVRLGERGPNAVGISATQFHITFNMQGRLILTDFNSKYGTAVSYTRTKPAKEELRRNFTWILDLRREKDGALRDVKVHLRNGLEFRVQVASHQTCEAEYKANLAECLKAIPTIAGLGINDPRTTAPPDQLVTLKKYPILIHERTLGRGSFGTVDRVVDVSTGFIYARKIFHLPREGRTENWLAKIRNEIGIMWRHPHVRTGPGLLGGEYGLTSGRNVLRRSQILEWSLGHSSSCHISSLEV
jgi:FHA domain